MNAETYIDYAKIIKAKFTFDNDGIKCSLLCTADDKRLGQTIISNLQSISSIAYMPETDTYRYKISDTIFVDISRTGEIKNTNMLTNFETRMLAQSKMNKVPFTRDNDNAYLPKTDLHTHFAGAMTADTILKVGLEHNIFYPSWCLEKVGIDLNKYNFNENGSIRLRDISQEDLKILESKLKLPQATQETFNKMEEIYALRGPFTKNKELFPDYLRMLADDYKKSGVEYAELSFSAFLTDPEYMQMLEENLPQIEKETGVKIRFLAGFWRHSDKEWNLDDVDRLKTIAKSPYIVGCDFMGHETNDTDTFKEELQIIARYALEEDPNFAIRVHAGENPIFENNVKKTLTIINDEWEKVKQETGADFPPPNVRIGHGLYGVDEETLDLARKMGAIIEFNMSSNLALNNIDGINEVPIKKYLDAGIDVVLGTDGHGLYSTYGGQEALLATAAGVTADDFEKILATENSVIKRAIQREQTHPNIQNVNELYAKISYSTETGQPRYNDEVALKYRLEQENALKRLDSQIAHIGAITDEKIIERDTEGKTPILITGASKKAWPKISEEDQRNIKITMQVLADTLNPETTYIVTGGTNFGVEKTMHEAVHRRNEVNDDNIVLLGTLTMEAAKMGTSEVEKDTITHATILEIDGHKANNWMDLPDTQLEYVKSRQGQMIAVGGGGVVKDMIQRAYNLDVDMHLMNGPVGASTDESKALAGNDYSFKTAQDLITRLYERNPNYFKKGFSLDQLDEYVSKGNDTVSNAIVQEASAELAAIDSAICDLKSELNINRNQTSVGKTL